MSSDFYFNKWRQTLKQLQSLVELDSEYQSTKQHDKTLCDAVLRLSNMVAQYTAVYNSIVECSQQNLQVQKTQYIQGIVDAVVSRMLELKHQLQKLEGNEYIFLSQGLAFSKLTPHDVELNELPSVKKRPEYLQVIVDEAFEAERERLRLLEESKLMPEEKDPENNWWDQEAVEEEELLEEKKELTQEEIDIKRNIELIQAHEKSRQVILTMTRNRNRREKWAKELFGTAKPPAPLEVRERSARLIQCVCRKYFEIKRKRIKDCKRDELIGLIFCLKPKSEEQEKWQEKAETRIKSKLKFEESRISNYQKVKEKIIQMKSEIIKDDYRDITFEWFKLWYEEIRYFHDIPDITQGSIALIIKEEMPSPTEWLHQYREYLLNMKANKNKSAMQLKYEKQEAKREAKMQKKEEQQKKKLEEQLRRKMMKNPSLHPGYKYPQSKKTQHLIEEIEKYNAAWSELDSTKARNVKENLIEAIELEDICKDVKIELAAAIDEDMRAELKLLNKALKLDYENNEEPMLEPIKQKKKREKKNPKVKHVASENIKEKIQDLILRGFMKEYPKTKLEDFKGDINFAGDKFRCEYRKAHHSNGETRSVWWEKCKELCHGFKKLLVVGPKGSGKTTLVYAMATMNDAVLFELDPLHVRIELQSDVCMDQLVHSLATCAKALQPTVIHIKHVQRLYYKKVPAEESENNYNLMKRYFINKLNKKIHSHDHVTIVATCLDPWLTKSSGMLKNFPQVLMAPNSSYSCVVQILKDWVNSDHVIPPDLNVSSLAQVLQGYSYGSLKKLLNDFLSAERLVRIKAYGLTPLDVYNYILEQESEEKVDYEKYEKWYSERTATGIKERKHYEELLEFKQAMDKYTQKAKVKKEKSSHSNLNEK